MNPSSSYKLSRFQFLPIVLGIFVPLVSFCFSLCPLLGVAYLKFNPPLCYPSFCLSSLLFSPSPFIGFITPSIMLEGSFRPPSSAAPQHHPYSHPQSHKTAYAQQSSMTAARRKELAHQSATGGPSFNPIVDRAHHQPSPGYDTDEHPQSTSPPAQHARFFHHPQPQHSSAQAQQAHSGFQASKPTLPHQVKQEPKPTESVPKDSSFGPVRAKKKAAGSACNSCHRLKVCDDL